MNKEVTCQGSSFIPDTVTRHRSSAVQLDLDTICVQEHSVDENLESIPEYQKCKAQIGTKFGCIPLAPIYVYRGEPKIWDTVPDVLTAHKLIRRMGIPNFLGLRIRVNTKLNVSSWRKHLVDYFDQGAGNLHLLESACLCLL